MVVRQAGVALRVARRRDCDVGSLGVIFAKHVWTLCMVACILRQVGAALE